MRLGTYYRYQLLSLFNLFSDIKETDKILDIGGFDGYVLSRLNSKSKTVVDININQKFKGVKYIENDFFQQKFSHNSFDYIFSFDVLEHIPLGTERRFIQKIISLLKKGGAAYLTTPSKDIKTFPNFLRKWIGRKWGHEKYLGYSKEELEDFLKNKNVDYKLIELNSSAFLNLYLFIRALQRITPQKLMEFILTKITQYDYKNHKGKNGYFLIKLKKLKLG